MRPRVREALSLRPPDPVVETAHHSAHIARRIRRKQSLDYFPAPHFCPHQYVVMFRQLYACAQ
jgi:hypothetical protein